MGNIAVHPTLDLDKIGRSAETVASGKLGPWSEVLEVLRRELFPHHIHIEGWHKKICRLIISLFVAILKLFPLNGPLPVIGVKSKLCVQSEFK